MCKWTLIDWLLIHFIWWKYVSAVFKRIRWQLYWSHNGDILILSLKYSHTHRVYGHENRRYKHVQTPYCGPCWTLFVWIELLAPLIYDPTWFEHNLLIWSQMHYHCTMRSCTASFSAPKWPEMFWIVDCVIICFIAILIFLSLQGKKISQQLEGTLFWSQPAPDRNIWLFSCTLCDYV